MPTNARLQFLLLRLNRFGLNPGEWRIEPRSRCRFRVFQPENEVYEFEGRVDKKLRWQFLEMKLKFALN